MNLNEEVAPEVTEDPVEEVVEEQEAVLSPRLVLKRGGQETEVIFLFGCPAMIGRFDPSVGPIDVDLGSIPEGSYVSRKHAKIHEEEGQYILSDLSSSNGTYRLDPEAGDFVKIDSTPISDGDEIAFGNARFVFRTS
jgi:pSer/pThr/pTyr-binding forkhead associated (FHA) protein